jgi:hypothetical protein
MISFKKSKTTWWQKPLVIINGRSLPAELAVLSINLKKDEQGVWINSRSSKSGAIDLERHETGFKTKRIEIPLFVTSTIERIYKTTANRKGCPDLVIWNAQTKNIRFVEVKCPHWDRVREGQKEFIQEAKNIGKETKIIEWEFLNAQHAAAADPRFANKTAQATKASSFAPRGQALAKAQRANADMCF